MHNKKIFILLMVFLLLPSISFCSEKKIALLFLTVNDVYHTQVWKKALKNCKGKYNIYVHSKEPIRSEYFSKHRIHHIVPTTWDRHVYAWKALLRSALREARNYKFIYLSESCIPLKPMEEIYEFLTKDNNSYMSYCKSYFREDSGREVLRLPKEHRYVNSEWVILNRKFARMVSRDKCVIRACNHYPHSTESHPSSLFSFYHCLTDPDMINQTTTYVNFILGKDSHPYTFEDASEFNINLIKEAQKNPKLLFIRKIGKKFPNEVLLKMIKHEL